jgi:maleylacetoacetate isomerase
MKFKPKLFHYWRSSASWRVRWALEVKGIAWIPVGVNLLESEQSKPEHANRSALGAVPAIELEPGLFLSESAAIIEYLEETHPQPPLLPRTPLDRARTRELFELINSGTHPLQNLSVQRRHSEDAAERKAWNQYWIARGLAAYERLLHKTAGLYSVGDSLTMADLALIPQVYNAVRFEVDLSGFPKIREINARALQLESCRRSHPDTYAPKT